MHMLDLTVHVDLFRYYKTEKPVVVVRGKKFLHTWQPMFLSLLTNDLLINSLIDKIGKNIP